MKTILLLVFTSLLWSQNNDENTANTKTTTEIINETEARNMKTVETFIKAVNSRDIETVKKLVHPDYIQHNPFIPTGREAFINLFPVLEEHNTYAETVRIFADGDFVVLHNIWHNATPFGAPKMVSFDVLRIDENGLIAEHWDALTPFVEETASGRSQTDGPTTITDVDKKEANKALARSIIEDVLMGKNPSKITEYISSEKYHQHNPEIKDGLSGIVEAVEYLTAQNNMFQYKKVHKILGAGNFVLTISSGEWSGKEQIFYDLFRFEDNKAVEHWDVIQPIPTENLANENTMFGF
ncbi:MAG: nuclear transport factor 2 family protein [bacterium]|nr:nuclear transport factor 2 family protein [bacterium]